jgi:gliding motility-associated-like protein
VGEVPDSVRNASQQACGVPQDFEPPCIGSVVFDTTRDCEALSIAFDWTNPDSVCGADLDFWNIYRADNRLGTYALIATIDSGVTTFSLTDPYSIADCFGVTAVDTNGNESEMRIFCFENCPQLDLGNVFTPNGDGINDFFTPLLDRSLKVQVVQIFDRWGRRVYVNQAVSDNDQLWNGQTNNGQPLPEGVYYYVIRFDEDHLPGNVPRRPVAGVVTLLR